MAVYNEPTQWTHPLGNNADVSTLPDDTGAGTGLASLQKLFQQINQLPLSAGGIAPSRTDFNSLFKVLGDSIFYAMNGGLPSYNAIYDYAVGRIVLHTDNKVYLCIQANDSTDPKDPSNSAYWSKIPTLSDFDEISFKTGDIKIHTTSTIPNGWLLCNGAAINRTTFSNLFTEIGTTYGDGDGSTTFNIPDLRDRYIIGANTNALGTYIAEQLPNITGGVTTAMFGNVFESITSSGAISLTKIANYRTWEVSNANGCHANLSFSASNSNAVYSDNGKVYPASIALNFIIKT